MVLWAMSRAITDSVLPLFLSVVLVPWSAAQTPHISEHAESTKLTIVVNDENGLPVPGARVQLRTAQLLNALRCETDFSGHCDFTGLPTGTCEVRIEKSNFYASLLPDLQIGSGRQVDVTLAAVPAVREVIDVQESPPAIDPAQISSKEELTGSELINIPYPGPHDYRNALNFIPGVTPDGFGQLHVAGAEGYQTLLLLDGFNVSQPTNGQLAVRTSIDSFRSIQITPSREPAEFGKGSGGVLALNTTMGDDRFRFLTTDFIPAPSTTRGLSIGQWTPIYSMSGPIQKGKTWFIDTLDGEYDDNVSVQLPPGKDRDYVWRADNLAKLQSNVTTRNIVTASFLSDYYHDKYAGLGFLVPQSATPTEVETAYLGSLKDQYYFHN